MSNSVARYSAETYLEEPGDLWRAGLPERFREQAIQLVPAGDGLRWAHPDGRALSELEEASRSSAEGTTSGGLLAALDRDGITGAVLHPSAAARAYSAYGDSDLLSAVLDAYNEWVLDLCSADSSRLKPVAMVNIDDPAGAAQRMRDLVERGAAGFGLPCAPGEGRRYDQRRYEVLWQTAAELGRPISLLSGTGRHPDARAKAGESAAPTPDPTPTVAGMLAFHATSVFPTRRSLTAMIFAGVFERHPALRVGAVGFGASWAAYAMGRAEEMYEVRPERAGPPTRVPATIRRPARTAEDADPEVGAIAGDSRKGTRGMAPEGVGYYFPDGESFGDHFRRNVFLTFRKDELALTLRDVLGVQTLLWGQGRQSRSEEPEESEGDGQARRTLEEFLADVPEGDRDLMTRENTARIYGFGPA